MYRKSRAHNCLGIHHDDKSGLHHDHDNWVKKLASHGDQSEKVGSA
jgi:hypothetical protein